MKSKKTNRQFLKELKVQRNNLYMYKPHLYFLNGKWRTTFPVHAQPRRGDCYEKWLKAKEIVRRLNK